MTDVREFLSATFGADLPTGLPRLEKAEGASSYGHHAALLEQLLADAGGANLIPLMQAQTWLVPTVGAVAPGFAENTMFVQLYGPETHPNLQNLRIGFFYMGPGFFYAAHVHEARETYIRLAGECEFTLGPDQDRQETAAYLINDPMEVHAMQAGPKGVLFAWMWTGDVSWESYSYV